MENFFNDIALRLSQTKKTDRIIGGLITQEKPTESDKPSPASSISQTAARRQLVWGDFTSENGYQIVGVANTNSMEPFIDQNCLVILEDLRGKWRDQRLRITPLAAGDIVIYEATVNGRKGRIIHELKQQTTFLGKPAWIIKGYNNFLVDMAKVPETAIIQRYVGHIACRRVQSGD